jgi:L,D-peptidoglycan transpeptidase YkuD (ErfK/YbiS/YcfS/YnhG family)
MIIINKSGYLKYKNLKFRCSLGKAGIGKKKIEGDNITPKGTFKIVNIYFRKDHIKNIISKLKLIKIKRTMGWCDDPTSKKYNQLIKLPTKYHHEKLYRSDKLYDIVIILNYNMNPIVKGKGSAIFLHLSKNLKNKTSGCVALRKKDMLELIKIIKKSTKVIIN